MEHHSSELGELVSGTVGAFAVAKSPGRQFARWLAVAGLAAGTVVFAQAGDRARTEAAARRATERLQGLQREADQLASDERTLLNDRRRLEVERQIKTEDVKR